LGKGEVVFLGEGLIRGSKNARENEREIEEGRMGEGNGVGGGRVSGGEIGVKG